MPILQLLAGICLPCDRPRIHRELHWHERRVHMRRGHLPRCGNLLRLPGWLVLRRRRRAACAVRGRHVQLAGRKCPAVHFMYVRVGLHEPRERVVVMLRYGRLVRPVPRGHLQLEPMDAMLRLHLLAGLHLRRHRYYKLRWQLGRLLAVPCGFQLRERRRECGAALHVLGGLRIDGGGQLVLRRHGGHLRVVLVDKRLHRRQRAASQRVAFLASLSYGNTITYLFSGNAISCHWGLQRIFIPVAAANGPRWRACRQRAQSRRRLLGWRERPG